MLAWSIFVDGVFVKLRLGSQFVGMPWLLTWLFKLDGVLTLFYLLFQLNFELFYELTARLGSLGDTPEEIPVRFKSSIRDSRPPAGEAFIPLLFLGKPDS